MSEVVLEWFLRILFLITIPINDIILSLHNDTIQNMVLLLKKISVIQKFNNILAIDTIIALFNVHGHEVNVWLALLIPLG